MNLFRNNLITFVCGLSALLTSCTQPNELGRVQTRETLHVITRNAPGIYYEGRETPEGFEYELASMFADSIGVDIDIKVANTRSQVRSALDSGFTNMAASMMHSQDEIAKKHFSSAPFLETTPLVVYRYGTPRPRNIDDMAGKRIAVVGDSHLNNFLIDLKEEHPQLKWQPLNIETVELIRMVQENEIDFAVLTSLELQLHRAFYPRVKRAFDLAEPQGISWLFPNAGDRSIVDAANRFIEKTKEDGTIMYLQERYFGHLAKINYVGARTFIRHAKKRLPTYEQTFQKFSDEHGTDWRLMAAMGYQESHWRSNAVSPTGVRGLMMLTRVTAKEMGVTNRLDPHESVRGGIKYFAKIHKRISDNVPEPDKTWFALAAYNVGYGHLKDAQTLTEKGGKDPNKWADVKEFLPLLEQKKYYSQTRYGYARGKEPVIYVQNIRRYYDVLRWIDESKQKERPQSSTTFEEQLLRYK